MYISSGVARDSCCDSNDTAMFDNKSGFCVYASDNSLHIWQSAWLTGPTPGIVVCSATNYNSYIWGLWREFPSTLYLCYSTWSAKCLTASD